MAESPALKAVYLLTGSDRPKIETALARLRRHFEPDAIELVSAQEGPPPALALRCTVEEARRFEPVNEFAYLRLGEAPKEDPGWDIGIESVLAQPYYGYGPGYGYEAGPIEPDPHVSTTYDRIPKGEVEIRRASDVTSAYGQHLGHVDGFLVDSEDAINAFLPPQSTRIADTVQEAVRRMRMAFDSSVGPS